MTLTVTSPSDALVAATLGVIELFAAYLDAELGIDDEQRRHRPPTEARPATLRSDRLIVLAQQTLRALNQTSPRVVPESTQRTEDVADHVNELTRVGKLWQVRFAGSSVHLPDLRGIGDLAVLLAQPGRDFAALDLATAGQAALRGDVRRVADTGAAGLGGEGALGDRIDAQARAAYAARIRYLQSELDDADTAGDAERGARAQQEIDFLTSELTAAYGMRGPRRAGDPAEKARSAVTARIRAAITKIGDAHPELGTHLSSSVRTGRFCSYRPANPTAWRVSRRPRTAQASNPT